MLLTVDAGNTQTVFGLFDGDRLLADWRIATRKEATADELGVLLHSLFERAGFQDKRPDGMIVSSVVPDLNEALAATGRSCAGSSFLARSARLLP